MPALSAGGERLPVRNGKVDGGECPRGQNRSGDDDSTGCLLADHQERYREARSREAAEDKPDRSVTRDTTTTDAIRKLLGERGRTDAALAGEIRK